MMMKKPDHNDIEEKTTTLVGELREQFMKFKGEKELTNSEIVRRSGLSPLSLTAFEKGTSVPSVSTLNRIACALNLDLKISFSPKGAVPEEEQQASPAEEAVICNYCMGDLPIMTTYHRNNQVCMFIDNEGKMDAFYGDKRILHGHVDFCPKCGRKFERKIDENLQKFLKNKQ
ncbi:MAG: helix-turn-helix domain-containing protein [Lachnospirales bacterium]